MSIKVYPYKQGSASAKKLAEAVGGKVLKHVGSKYRPKRGDVVVNWGAARLPDFGPATTLNPDVTVAGCKLASFNQLSEAGVTVPPFTTDKAVAEGWGTTVVCRTKLRGHSGDGIVMASVPAEIVNAPLYTQYVKKKDEYRVHVMRKPNRLQVGGNDNSVIFIQRKARKLDHEAPNWQIRNLAGGFAFTEVAEADVPGDVLNQALSAARALGLDFGGVDVMWNAKEAQAYVLEVNCACGLEDRTAQKYKEALHNYIDNVG